jgi:dynein assembly factor 1
MTKESVEKSCLDHDGSLTPEINRSLHLQFSGYEEIENLEPYTGLHGLFLNCNRITVLENLHTLRLLRVLELRQNFIEKIEGLCELKELVALDLTMNRISRIENLEGSPKLATLLIGKNQLQTRDEVQSIVTCQSITKLDISDNKICELDVLRIFNSIPKLSALMLEGNPMCKRKFFRKIAISKCNDHLCYLDGRIYDAERVGARAFDLGGREAELAAKDAFRKDKEIQKMASSASFVKWSEEMRAKREAQIQRITDSDPNANPSEYCAITEYHVVCCSVNCLYSGVVERLERLFHE